MAKKKEAKKKEKGEIAQKRAKLYNVSGDKVERNARTCPKCGAGVFMASHKDRNTCGKCNHTEFNKK